MEELQDQDIRELYSLPEVVTVLAAYKPWYIPSEHPIDSVVDRMNWVASLMPRPEIEALIRCAQSLKPVGFVCLSGIDNINSKAELSIGLFRGIGTRILPETLHWVFQTAFATIHKLVFCVSPTNKEALKLIEHLGIPLEATLKDEILTQNGTRQDLLRFAIFSSDWDGSTLQRRLQRWAPLPSNLATHIGTPQDLNDDQIVGTGSSP